MTLVQLIYRSRMTSPLSMDAMVEILDAARRHNAKRGVTGFLAFTADHFLQALEGEAREVNALYARILNDLRHKDVELICYREVPERAFSQWSMGCADLARLNDDQGQPGWTSFDPYVWDTTRTLQLLDTAAKSGRGAVELLESTEY